MCHVQPLGVTKNATFIVDVDDVAFSDLKADDLGTWKTNGTKTTHFWIRPSGTIVISPKQKGPDTKSYIMTRRYYVHGTYQLFRRIIIDIKGIFQYTLVCNFIAFSCIDGNGQRHKYALVQYLFDGPEVEVKIKPHGNSSHARPYFRTSESTKQRLQEISATQKPKEAINVLMMEKGGEVHARGAGCVPRDSRQISYLREKKHTKDPNPLYSVMLECKLAQGKTEMFVQDVKAAPQPMCVLSFNRQLDDMERFLTNNHQFGILTVDTTYNLGDFYVTALTYPHLMIEDVTTKKSPLLLGPVLVHQSTNFSAFNYFASTLVGCRPNLRHVLAFGSDGDKALVEAFTHNFAYAIQLRCFIHFRRNVAEKLKNLGFSSSISQEFLDDIFGKHIRNSYQEGLVDCCSSDDFDRRLSQLKSVWDSRESLHLSTAESSFYNFFLKYQSTVIKYHMRKDLRECVGLGSPPSIFTTNGSESINAAIKRKVDHKESDWPQFNEQIKNLVRSQHEEVTRALSQRGKYILKPEYAHYGVTTQEWMKMRPDQRQNIIEGFQKATLKVSVTSFKKATTPSSCTEVAMPCNSATVGEDSIHGQEPISTVTLQTDLSISADDAGITTIPLVTLNAMWTKAVELLSTSNAITAAPGNQEKACMVISYSQVAPHLIRVESDGQYVCDSNCQQWVSSQLCSHTLAAAERNGDLSFLEWYTRYAESPNISMLAMSNLPRGRGRKGGRPKRQRNRNYNPPVDNITVRPGTLVNVSHDNVMVGAGSMSNVQVFPDSSSTPFSSGVFSDRGFSSTPFSSGPPPLIRLPSSNASIYQPVIINPFFVKVLAGNIRVCQGCRGSLRHTDGSIPSPPFDLVIARMEKRSYRDSSGILKTPNRPSAAHYHLKLTCVRGIEPNFIPTAENFQIPSDILPLLTFQHRQHFHVEFGLDL